MVVVVPVAEVVEVADVSVAVVVVSVVVVSVVEVPVVVVGVAVVVVVAVAVVVVKAELEHGLHRVERPGDDEDSLLILSASADTEESSKFSKK